MIELYRRKFQKDMFDLIFRNWKEVKYQEDILNNMLYEFYFAGSRISVNLILDKYFTVLISCDEKTVDYHIFDDIDQQFGEICGYLTDIASSYAIMKGIADKYRDSNLIVKTE